LINKDPSNQLSETTSNIHLYPFKEQITMDALFPFEIKSSIIPIQRTNHKRYPKIISKIERSRTIRNKKPIKLNSIN
jgi:hypothetical protein